MTWSFLVPHAGNPAMLAACLTSIRSRNNHRLDDIIIGVRGDDPYCPRAKEVADAFSTGVVTIPGNGDDTDEVMAQLFEACKTDYAVYIEADCLLVSDLQPLRVLVEAGGFVGIEEKILWPEGTPGNRLGPDDKFFRYAPGFHTASFFMLPVADFKARFGAHGVCRDRAQGGEPYYGLSEQVHRSGWSINNCTVRHLGEPFGYATLYGDFAVHMWFGGWRLRQFDNLISSSGVPPEYIAAAETELLDAFWTDGLKGAINASLSNGVS